MKLSLQTSGVLRATLLAAGVHFGCAGLAPAQELAPARESAEAQDVAVAPGAEGAALTRSITLPLGRSQVVDTPWPVKRVSVTSAEIADVQVLSPTKVLVIGKALGSTDLFLWSETEALWKAEVEVVADLKRYERALSRAFPGSRLELSQSRDVVVVSGYLTRAEHSLQLRTFMDSLGFKYVDRTALAGVQQVQIKVRVAEVSRTAIKALGVNVYHVGEDVFGGSVIGPASGGPLNPVSVGVLKGTPAAPDIPFAFPNDVSVSPGITLFGGLTDHNVEAFVQALAENQYLRILAEPNLVALSGEEATFLAGGEFPIPVVQGSSGGGSTSITIDYKEFGVRLSFRPTVLGDGAIRLTVSPEVSELTEQGAVEIQGFRIPSILTRRSSTTLELKSGQSFAMAGLLNSRKDARSSQIPVLGSIPILGALFRSVRYTSGETELVVMATASLVEPISLTKSAPLPGTIEVPENDWQIFLEGKIDGNIPSSFRPDPAVFKTLGLGKLKGPGAWTRHDKKPARARPGFEEPASPAEESEPSEPAAATPAEAAASAGDLDHDRSPN